MRTLFRQLLLLAGLAAAAAPLCAQEGSRDQTVGEEAARQIGELARDKRARTPAQRKIDPQLLYALRQKRGEKRGVPSAPVEIQLDAEGRAVVEITARVTPRLVAAVKKLGAEVISTAEKYHTIRAAVALERLEAIAALKDVRYIGRPSGAMTNKGGGKN